MNLYYVTNAVIPGKRVHAYQICKMCEAFANNGLKTTLVLPRSSQILDRSLFELYSCKNNFEVNYVSIFFDFINLPGAIKFRLDLFIFSIFVFLKFIFVKKQDSIIFSRDYLIAWLLKKIGFFVIYEAHNPILKTRYFSMLSKIDLVVTNSEGTAKEFVDRGFQNVKPLPNGVDVELFDIDKSKVEARKHLNINDDKKILVYTGSLYKWKGVDLLVDAARKIKENKDILFIILGGNTKEVEKYKNIIKEERLDNIKFLGHKENKIIPLYLKSADILLIPDLPLEKRSICYTSPLKMFEYLISRRLVLVSDLLSMKKLVSKKEVVFFKAGDVEDMVDKIMDNLGKENKEIIDNAYSLALVNNWDKRAEKIINFIK